MKKLILNSLIILITSCNNGYDQLKLDLIRMSCTKKASMITLNYILQHSECENKTCVYEWLDVWIVKCIKESLK